MYRYLLWPIALVSQLSYAAHSTPHRPFPHPTEPIHLLHNSIQETKSFILRNPHLQGKIEDIHPTLTGDLVSLERYQTPIRDQAGRGSCWAMASIAALEAAYKRQYGMNLSLSEEYVFHIQKAGELYSDYATNAIPHENNSSYWGFQGNSGVVFNMLRYAIPTLEEIPYLTGAQMETLKNSIPGIGTLAFDSATQKQLDSLEFHPRHIPLNGRLNPKYRVTGAQALPDLNISTLETLIRSNKEVITDVDVCWKYNNSTGVYENDAKACVGGHVFLIIGFDKAKQFFLVKNSWGEGGYIKVSYDFIKHNLKYGTYITSIAPPNSPIDTKARWIGRWNMDHDGWKGELVIRRFTDFRNSNASAPTKLGNYYRDGKSFDVNGFVADDGRKMVFHIADKEGRVKPGTLQGQEFITYVFSWDGLNAAGSTAWNGSPFGVTLSRNAIGGSYANSFQINKWVGSWHMNHDGWKGMLNITHIVPMPNGLNRIQGNYVDHTGKTLPMSGTIANNRTHLANVTVNFDASNHQPFQLLYHTWETGIFSGTTQWSGMNFGVQGQL